MLKQMSRFVCLNLSPSVCVCAFVVRACVRACVPACVHACARSRVCCFILLRFGNHFAKEEQAGRFSYCISFLFA